MFHGRHSPLYYFDPVLFIVPTSSYDKTLLCTIKVSNLCDPKPSTFESGENLQGKIQTLNAGVWRGILSINRWLICGFVKFRLVLINYVTVIKIDEHIKCANVKRMGPSTKSHSATPTIYIGHPSIRYHRIYADAPRSYLLASICNILLALTADGCRGTKPRSHPARRYK
ncbi:hypothetical protein TcasGA2_TC012264 [Tribolium castaneum]|uniref:Uncharacterized protein n=1 Tax=Tribolium castaneum TaxID=7070 RepID=D6X086_TRICA|nr:hypothetical protein TcasGA2_TC012264 [Tribolium castaneum]